jgi:hypothetical protein
MAIELNSGAIGEGFFPLYADNPRTALSRHPQGEIEGLVEIFRSIAIQR